MSKPAKSKSGKPKSKPRRTEGARALVVLYGLDTGTPRGDAVREVAERLGIGVRTIGQDELGKSVGSVAGLMGSAKSGTPYAGDAPDVEFMLVSGLANSQLDSLLVALREAGASVALKAQVTPHNRFWPVHMLISEVAKEHAAMTKADAGR